MSNSPNKKPALLVALGLLLVATLIVFITTRGGGNDPYSVERLSETLTIVDANTGDTWEMERGFMERSLRGRRGQIDPSEGIMNPNTGTPTGFPEDRDDWNATVERINGEKAAALERSGGGG